MKGNILKAVFRICYTCHMAINNFKYNIIIRKEGKDYIAEVPTLGISDFGKTIEEAKKNIREAVRCHIEGLIKTKNEIPAPDSEEFYISNTEVSISKNLRFAY
jgi:predicted RNase H-like HicB family nuclease